jgi:hypothetical protein
MSMLWFVAVGVVLARRDNAPVRAAALQPASR